MVNSASMSTERAIPDLWEVFGSRSGMVLPVRRNSWQKMQAQLSEEERAVTELFNDLHIHAKVDLSSDPVPPTSTKRNSNQRTRTEETTVYNDRNHTTHNWENIEKHLSMKKTIRKKMMRDLQQAFIDGQDPAECQQWDQQHVTVQLDAHKAGVEPNLLDMLKDKTNNSSETTQGAAAAPSSGKKPGFWKKLTTRTTTKSKR